MYGESVSSTMRRFELDVFSRFQPNGDGHHGHHKYTPLNFPIDMWHGYGQAPAKVSSAFFGSESAPCLEPSLQGISTFSSTWYVYLTAHSRRIQVVIGGQENHQYVSIHRCRIVLMYDI